MKLLAFVFLAVTATSAAADTHGLKRVHKRVLDVRDDPTLPNGWAEGSCIVDSTSTRALGSYHVTDSSGNTPVNCINTCASKGFSYAGVEYGDECWCANSITKSGTVGSTAADTDCNKPCSGDPTQNCGNSNRLQVYHSSTPVLPSGWSKGACIVDSTSTRALGAFHTSGGTNTPSNCIQSCISQGYSYAGVEYGSECYCDNQITKSGSVGSTASSGECSMKCSGDSSQTCGNGNRLQIYHTTASIVPSGWTETGCIIDSSSARALGAYQTTSSTNTPSNCIHTCTSKSYYYAGVEYGDECWCANTITKSGSVGGTAASSDCNQNCAGDSNQKCGSGNRLTVYHNPNAPHSGSAASTSSSGDYNYGPKVGLAWGGSNDQLSLWKSPHVGSMYNWNEKCPSSQDLSGLDCYPMLWGWRNAAAFKKAVVPGYAKVALCINEPNEPGQANLSPQDAVTLYREYCYPLKAHGYKLGSPATSSNPNGYTWMEEFFKLCGSDHCGVDFMCLHWYDIGFAKFQTYVEKWHNGFGKDIMVTEFADQNFNGGAQASCSDVITFLEQATAWLQKTSWVLKYKWFGAMPDMQGVSNCNKLMAGGGGPNDLGYKFLYPPS